jgi:hypothetical protein
VFIRTDIQEKWKRVGIVSRVSADPDGLRGTSSQRGQHDEKLTNSTVDWDIALLEKEEKAGRRGRVEKRNIQQMQKESGTIFKLGNSSASSDIPDLVLLLEQHPALSYFLSSRSRRPQPDIVFFSAIKRMIFLDGYQLFFSSFPLEAPWARCSLFLDIFPVFHRHALQSASGFSVCGCSCSCARAAHACPTF